MKKRLIYLNYSKYSRKDSFYMLTNEELLVTCGGITKWGIIGLATAGVIAFAIGFVDGYTRKLKCNK